MNRDDLITPSEGNKSGDDGKTRQGGRSDPNDIKPKTTKEPGLGLNDDR